MNGRDPRLNDANDAPTSGTRKGSYIREKWQRDATFIRTVLGADPAKSFIEALKEDQAREEAAADEHIKRELDLINTDISRNEAEVKRVAESVARLDKEEEDLLKRQDETEESLGATEIKIVEKYGEILEARSRHALLAIQRRREEREALDALRGESEPEHDQQEPEGWWFAREHEAHLSRSLRGSIFSRPVAILLMWVGLVGLPVLGWWTGERIRTVVETTRLAGVLDRLAVVITSLIDGGIVWRAVVALAVLLLLAVVVTGVRKDLVRRILPARGSRANGPAPDEPAHEGWARYASIFLGVMAVPLLAVATIGLLLGGTDLGPMLATFVGAGAFTLAGTAFCMVIGGATAFWVAAEMDVRDGEGSRARSVPRPFGFVLSVCLAVVVLLEGIRMVRMGAYDLFTFDHAFLPILMTPIASICLLWGAIYLGRHRHLRRAQVPTITRDDLDFSPELVAEREALVARRRLQAEELDRIRQELERVKDNRQEDRQSLDKLHEDSAQMGQRKHQARNEHHEKLMKMRRHYREQISNLDLARSMGIRARNLPDADALRTALADTESDSNGETGI